MEHKKDLLFVGSKASPFVLQGKPPIGRITRSSVLDRVHSFMPLIKQANTELEEKAKINASAYNIEDVNEGEPFVEMNLGLVKCGSDDPEEEEKQDEEEEEQEQEEKEEDEDDQDDEIPTPTILSFLLNRPKIEEFLPSETTGNVDSTADNSDDGGSSEGQATNTSCTETEGTTKINETIRN
eukprot:TRINITY_DN11518_c0_g1_i1.p1 TRINITY_DN11518_c0_g1~~TRINITY_DN11518_c0_g1_i1.p1  ORF type:complete len:197 (-),score=62.13 TRINITY_DN11518_c0_g1_i1:22-567(-)